MRLATDVPLKLSVARGNILVGIIRMELCPWRGNFFPNGLPQKLELAYAARRFGALEVNGTFYSLQRPSTFTSWYHQTPPGFMFALKGGRFITHMRKLREPLAPLANFFASGPLCLREVFLTIVFFRCCAITGFLWWWPTWPAAFQRHTT
jgi:uncharacterized protein YecE (DUF72 family)